jgi:hypothetical protein
MEVWYAVCATADSIIRVVFLESSSHLCWASSNFLHSSICSELDCERDHGGRILVHNSLLDKFFSSR